MEKEDIVPLFNKLRFDDLSLVGGLEMQLLKCKRITTLSYKEHYDRDYASIWKNRRMASN